ncbi:MAG TPA: tetratricopeptide repeat protein, partial [Verrucomicrobiota bacterium]|nr:tetratricopeptide repeat protein [Verrucomicrobiota bacterium]
MEQNAAVGLPLSDRLWVWFEANGKKAIWGVVGAAVLVFVVAFFVWNKNQSETNASQALSAAEVQIALSGGARDASAEVYLKVASDHPGTAAAGRAILQAGAALFVRGKYAEAQSELERFIRDYSSSPFIPQALLGIASCLEAQGKTDDAAKAYEALTKNHSASAVAPKAEFALANIYESQGRFQEAWFLFEKLARAGLNTSIGSEAGMHA